MGKVIQLRGSAEDASALDAKFFRARPYRRHRIRRASADEVRQIATVSDKTKIAEGGAWFAAVKKLTPKARFKKFFVTDETNDGDLLTEAQAAAIFADAMQHGR